MDRSFIYLNRLVEEKIRASPGLYTKRPVLSTARALEDEQLLEKLLSLSGNLDRETFRQLCASHVSAQKMVEAIEVDGPSRFDADWPWLAATVLWERWAPDIPSFEMIDNAMQAGYHAPDTAKKCEIWLDVWSQLLSLAERHHFTKLSTLDKSFAGTQCLFNWVQDLEMELSNGRPVIDRFLEERLRFCEEYLSRFGEEHPDIDQGMWRAIAEVHNEKGDVETVDRLYREWLTADPYWGWGWITWADCYWLFTPRERDFSKGEKILREGLAIAELRDRGDVLERLADLCGESGRPEEQRQVVEELEALRGVAQRGKQDPPQPVVKKKIGRNTPCPCGSGKKYKKCCLRNV